MRWTQTERSHCCAEDDDNAAAGAYCHPRLPGGGHSGAARPAGGRASSCRLSWKFAGGARRVYKLHPEGIAELRSYLDGFWSRSLRAFKAAAEAGEEEDR